MHFFLLPNKTNNINVLKRSHLAIIMLNFEDMIWTKNKQNNSNVIK
jgi:hypothetical protein